MFAAAAGVKLVFKPAGLLSDEQYAHVSAMYESDEVKEILGLTERTPAPAPDVPAPEAPKASATLNEMDEVLSAPAPAPAAKKAKAPAPAPAGDLVDSLDALLSGAKDDA